MEADLRARLAADPAVAALVGGAVSWSERASAASLPAITLTLIVPGRTYHLDGTDNLQRPRVQADCWARSHLEATVLAGAVIAALEPPASVGATAFGAAMLDGNRDVDPEDLPGGVRVFRRSLDFSIWHEPA